MTIERADNRSLICCDRCPASYPNTYADEDFNVMIADIRTAGWRVVKAKIDSAEGEGTAELFGAAPRAAGNTSDRQPYIHICPACQHQGGQSGGLL